MRKVDLYVVHSDRSIKKHAAKATLPDYLDTKAGRWLFQPANIFDAQPLAEFESWSDFLGWKPLVGPPKKPAALAIAGDMMPQAPVAITDDELATMLTRTPVAAAQDLMTTVGTMDSKQSALTWGLVAVLGACSLAIIVIAMIAAIAFLSGGDDAPAPPETPPSMSAPTSAAPAPVGTPWPWPTPPVPQPTAVPVSQPRRRRQARLASRLRVMRRQARLGLASRVMRRQARLGLTFRLMRRQARRCGLLRPPATRWARLLVYDAALPGKPYMVGLPRLALHRHFDDVGLRESGRSRMYVCRRDGEAIKLLPLERDKRSDVTPEFLAEVRKWYGKHAKDKAKLLVYDEALPEQPYMATMPRHVLRSRFGGAHEIKAGRSSMWACRRTGDEFNPIPVDRDQRTTRTPAFVQEYMKLRADKAVLGRTLDKAQKLLMMGAAVGIVVTVVAGLFLTVALVG